MTDPLRMTDPLSYSIGRDPGSSLNCTAVAIVVGEPVWIRPDSERGLVVPRSRWRSNGRP
jgi:hypothetical protein